ncbi:MAG TPA: hypothetical protein VHD90_03240, partial [Phototrophicaceae bacterium]|nr:hypothetical protein [Phototrophicaceae bacterium]
MLPRHTRPLFFFLLLLLFIVAPVLAAPNLTVSIAHTGNAGVSNADFLVGSTTGTVVVNLQNTGADPTTTDTTLTITLAGGLTYGGSVVSTPGGFFTSCTGTSTVTCTTSTPIPNGASENITFPVTAPAAASTNLVNKVNVNSGTNVNDPTMFAIDQPVSIQSFTHTGNSGSNFVINSTNGSVTIKLQANTNVSLGTTTTLNIVLGAGLTFNAQSAGSLFTNCGPANSSLVTCSTSAAMSQVTTGNPTTDTIT